MSNLKVIGLGMGGAFLGMMLFTGLAFMTDVVSVDRNGAVYFRVTDAGNVGIGNPAPDPPSRLTVRGAGTTSATSALDVQASNGTSRLLVRDDGKVGIGTSSPETPLHIGGGWGDKLRTYNFKIVDDNDPNIMVMDTSNSTWKTILRIDGYGNGFGNMTIGGGVASSVDAKLEIGGTDGALLIPRLTTAQRDALTAADGMVIYNTTTSAFNFRESGAWGTK